MSKIAKEKKFFHVYKLNYETPDNLLGNPEFKIKYPPKNLETSEKFIICIYPQARYFHKDYFQKHKNFTNQIDFIENEILMAFYDKVSPKNIANFFTSNFSSVVIYNGKFFQITIKNIYEKAALNFINFYKKEFWENFRLISPKLLYFLKSPEKKINKKKYKPVKALSKLKAYYTENEVPIEDSFFQLENGLPTSLNFQTTKEEDASGYKHFTYYFQEDQTTHYIVLDQNINPNDPKFKKPSNCETRPNNFFLSINKENELGGMIPCYYFPSGEKINPIQSPNRPKSSQSYAKISQKSPKNSQDSTESSQNSSEQAPYGQFYSQKNPPIPYPLHVQPHQNKIPKKSNSTPQVNLQIPKDIDQSISSIPTYKYHLFNSILSDIDIKTIMNQKSLNIYNITSRYSTFSQQRSIFEIESKKELSSTDISNLESIIESHQNQNSSNNYCHCHIIKLTDQNSSKYDDDYDERDEQTLEIPEENILYAKYPQNYSRLTVDQKKSKEEDILFCLPLEPLFFIWEPKYIKIVFSRNIQTEKHINELISLFPTIYSFKKQ